MIAESGVGRIIEVDKDGKIHTEIKLSRKSPAHAHGNANWRMATISFVRKSRRRDRIQRQERVSGITHKTRVLRRHPAQERHTLIASGSGASVVEVSPAGMVVWESRRGSRTPGSRSNDHVSDGARQANFIVGNCHAGEKSLIFEITRARKLSGNQRVRNLRNGLACSQVLDDNQSTLVRKLLAKVTDEE